MFCAQSPSCVQLFVAQWTIAHQTPLSLEFSGQEYWSELHALLQRMFPTPGLNPRLLCLLHWQADSLPLEPLGSRQAN